MKYKFFLIYLLLAIFATSCNDDVDSSTEWKQYPMSQQLLDTSWRQYSCIIYKKDGTQITSLDGLRPYVYYLTDREFYNEELAEHKHRCRLEVYDLEQRKIIYGDWYMADKTEIHAWGPPSFYGEISKLTSEELEVCTKYDASSVNPDWDYMITKFKRVELDGSDFNSGSGNGGNSSNVTDIIKRNINVKGSYNDFMTTITVEHTIKKELKNADVKLRVFHESSDAEQSFELSHDSWGNPEYYWGIYKYSTSGDKVLITVKYPIVSYLCLLWVDLSNKYGSNNGETKLAENDYTDAEMHWATYCTLVEKMQTETLTDAEKSLQIELYKELKNLEKKAYFADYNLVIYLIVDGKTYKAGTYKPVKTYL